MGLFDKMKEPVFLKENSVVEAQLEKLRALVPILNEEGQARIKQDIKYLEYGIEGEKRISFELKNTHMPMYILHDIYLEDGELNAQIDYLVFTKKMCFVIECKNLYGDIEINNAGDFIRTINFDGKIKREGIYSPITQNQRHLELMKKIKVDKKKNIFTKFMAERYFEDFNKSIVVLANTKTVLKAQSAKKEIKDKVIRADKLVSYIKEMYKQCKESECSEERLLIWAQSYLELHKEVEKDYTSKYDQYKIKGNNSRLIAQRILNKKIESNFNDIEDTEIFKELKEYRLVKSRQENIKPYFIYNNDQLKDLISKMPRNQEDLQLVNGFGEVKTKKYGDDILKVISKYF